MQNTSIQDGHHLPSAWCFAALRGLNLCSVLATLALIVSISMEAFTGQVFAGSSLYTRIQLWVCLYFLLDVLVRAVLAPRGAAFHAAPSGAVAVIYPVFKLDRSL